MHVGGPFADKVGLEKSSSDGLVKEVLIWQHRALILLSPSPGSPMSISGTSKKGAHSWGGEEGKVGKRESGKNRTNGGGTGEGEDWVDGEKKQIIYSFL